MPCNFCQGNEDDEIEICSDCLKFLTNLKCVECKNIVSFKKKFNVICDECISKGQKQIGKDNIENNLLNDIPIYDNKKFIDFYDIIFNINSIRDILNGWKIEFGKNGKDYYDKMKVGNFLKIGAIGDGNKGKTFLLQKLAKIELPTGYSIKTEGLSIRCPDIDSENQNIILLDSKGEDYPLLEDSNFEFNKFLNDPKELKKQLDDLANDKRLTENFLRQIIIKESNLLLVVVGNLTYKEQKLINEIKEESNNRNQSIYIIHNLQTFVEKSQVENYIEETLMKSATFRLFKNKEIRLRREEENEDLTENNIYFIESFSENHKNVYHLIMAKENSPAGNYYNNFVIRFLRRQMNNFPQQTSFPIIKKIKDYFFDMSRYYLEYPLKYDSFEETEDIIQVKKGTEIKLKTTIYDETSISNFIGKSYNPRYCYFIHNNRFYFQIELPGNFDKKQFKYNIFDKDNYYIIDINSSKFIGTKDFFPKEKDGRKFFNNREEGPFHLRFSVLAEDFKFKEKKIKLPKMGKKLKEEKKEDVKEEEKMINLLKASKEEEKEDIMPEEGVLTFYIELQEESQEEHPLSSSDEDDH